MPIRRRQLLGRRELGTPKIAVIKTRTRSEGRLGYTLSRLRWFLEA